MKEEEWRDPIALGIIASGPPKRYSLSEISGVKESYAGNPGGTKFDDLGQMVFALNNGGAICLGQCQCGCNLIPYGFCCYMNCNAAANCSSAGCVACGFTLGGAGTIYVALGSINGCGATLFRRIL
jgi:hypothetical protein